MSCCRRLYRDEGGQSALHKTFHWLNGEGSYAHIGISSFFFFYLRQSQGFQGEQVDGKCVCVCVRWGREGSGLVVCNDSPSWIKCGTLIWRKIMESYMSLSMSAFQSRSKWKVTAIRGWGGWQRCWNGNRATMRLTMRLTWRQTDPGLTVIQHQAV